MCARQHRIPRNGIALPVLDRDAIDLAFLPLPQRVLRPLLNPSALLFLRDIEIIFDQMHAAMVEQALEPGRDDEELLMFASVQKPITRLTPARLYQLRFKSAISPEAADAKRNAENIRIAVPDPMEDRGRPHGSRAG